MTRTEYMNDVLLARLDREEWPDEYYRPFVEYRAGHGWYLVFPESRYIGDDGEYLAATWQDAEWYLAKLIG